MDAKSGKTIMRATIFERSTTIFELDCNEVDGDGNDRITIMALTRAGIWVSFFSCVVTEEMIDGYMFPLILKAENKLQELNSDPLAEHDS